MASERPSSPTSDDSPERSLRVALVHHWLTRRRGGEKCLDSLARLYPGADLFTLIHDPKKCPAPAEVRRVITSNLQNRLGAKRWFRAWMPRFPHYYRSLDLAGYDLVVTSDASVAKTVMVPEGIPHVCYCYSPVRYAFDMREVYLRESVPALLRPLARHLLNRLGEADREAAQRVTSFIAISQHVAQRISRCYDRPSEVIYPPVDVDFFQPAVKEPEPSQLHSRPYLLLGEAVAYKRFDLGVRACRTLGRDLIVAGSGPHHDRLRRLAGPRTRFVTDPGNEEVRELYRSCRALIFPGEEDFGMVPVEAMACGRPVIARNAGGATETVVDGSTGILYDEDSEEGLMNAIRRFEASEDTFQSRDAVAKANLFSVGVHERAMKHALATFAG